LIKFHQAFESVDSTVCHVEEDNDSLSVVQSLVSKSRNDDSERVTVQCRLWDTD